MEYNLLYIVWPWTELSQFSFQMSLGRAEHDHMLKIRMGSKKCIKTWLISIKSSAADIKDSANNVIVTTMINSLSNVLKSCVQPISKWDALKLCSKIVSSPQITWNGVRNTYIRCARQPLVIVRRLKPSNKWQPETEKRNSTEQR